jgi:predicted DCC family thiol-disulfide oxidoreductase YuxK
MVLVEKDEPFREHGIFTQERQRVSRHSDLVAGMAEAKERIIFFDGVCGLCNRFVDRLLRIDGGRRLLFAPLLGSTARARLPTGLADAMESVVYLRDGIVLQRSDAALRILMDLGGWRKVHGALFIVPRFIRDAAYDWVARNRYKWFGKHAACRMPSAAERERFLP